MFLMGLYLIHTTGELCLSPVGLSMVTKLAPEKMVGMVMGSWFISIAIGNYLAGQFSSVAARGVEAVKDQGMLAQCHAYGDAFTTLMFVTLGVGVVLFLVAPFMNKWMHGVK
jgi:POT family proton-dependent oligopeptide transporter